MACYSEIKGNKMYVSIEINNLPGTILSHFVHGKEEILHKPAGLGQWKER
jgi:hypothetical protein